MIVTYYTIGICWNDGIVDGFYNSNNKSLPVLKLDNNDLFADSSNKDKSIDIVRKELRARQSLI